MEQNSIVESIGDKKIKIMLWDTDSNKAHHSIRSVYYRKAELIFVVQDLSLSNSIEGVVFWIDSIKCRGANSMVYLIGTKTDICDTVYL